MICVKDKRCFVPDQALMKHIPFPSALLEARVPRYTSFPPANRFSSDVGPAQMASWLDAVPDGAPISLYIHVPFCRRLCWFCACHTQGARTDEPVDRYLEHLEEEIAMVRAQLPAKLHVTALHLGGGTPTLLSPDRLDRLAAMIAASFSQQGQKDFSVEIDPAECDAARLDRLIAQGLTRASIGVQDFDPTVQSAIGRHQSAELTAETVQALRNRGIGAINFDLLYGLPLQSQATLAATLQNVIEMRPDRIALYGYAHVPWMSRRQRLIPDHVLPDTQERVMQASMAREALIANGYVPIGIDHYALPHDALAVAARAGTLRRNFQGYTTDQAPTLIGFGPSAISRFDQGYAQNAPATGQWQSAVSGGALATVRGHLLSRNDRLHADIIETLMCRGMVDLADCCTRYEADLAPLIRCAHKVVEQLPDAAKLEGTKIVVSSPLYTRLVASRLDPGLERQTDRFSEAS
ncbi:MAG: oxygen-independent coproporphyrinogen III oxidase [Limimaricola soesokkakensis]|uniref:oxygen-independent coproporphyrinogen III oxidase n=2 Tax=Limimaricola soesokkakensis TaxID=1343159 RepID=UPI004059A455